MYVKQKLIRERHNLFCKDNKNITYFINNFIHPLIDTADYTDKKRRLMLPGYCIKYMYVFGKRMNLLLKNMLWVAM